MATVDTTQKYGTGGQALGANQLNPHLYERKALIDARKEQYFGQLSNTKSMPKNSGKQIKKYHIIPLLDDRNINEMGLDAKGAKYANGNLYGSSKDIGVITEKLPVLAEGAEKVNRVGYTRREISSNLEKFGFHTDFTEELLDFDSDAELLQHFVRENMNGAVQINEAQLQKDLLNNAGLVHYTGTATSKANISTTELTYADLIRLSVALDNNRTPKHTTIITGTRMIDTKTIPACRVAYVGSELIPTLEAMKDFHNQPALVKAEKYAGGTTLLNGEYGAIAGFRIVVVPEMMRWAGKGEDNSNTAYYRTGGKLDVFPFLVVGDESFSDIGFQTDGKSNKFKTITKRGGLDTATSDKPFGDKGFSSVMWWYGFMAERPERIGLILTAAKL